MSVSKDVEKSESLYTIGGNVKWSSHYRKQFIKERDLLDLQFYVAGEASQSWPEGKEEQVTSYMDGGRQSKREFVQDNSSFNFNFI